MYHHQLKTRPWHLLSYWIVQITMSVQDREKKFTSTKTLSRQFSVVPLWIMLVNVHHFCSKTHLSHSYAMKSHVVGHQVEHNWFLRKCRHFKLSLQDEIASFTHMVRCGETAKTIRRWVICTFASTGAIEHIQSMNICLWIICCCTVTLSSLQMKSEKNKINTVQMTLFLQ